MRVLHCIPSMEGGGAERQLTYLAGALRRLECDIHVAIVSGGPNLDRLQASGATIHRLGAGIGNNHDPRALFRLLTLVRRLRPDVMQAWFLQMEAHVCVSALLTRVPWVMAERSSELAYPPTVKNRLRVLIGSRANAIVSNSAAGDRYWATRVRATTPRAVIPNAIPIDEIAAAQPVPDGEAGLAPGELLVLFAGRFVPEKNLETLIAALAKVFAQSPGRAVLLGDGPLRAHLVGAIAQHGLAGRVRVGDYVANLWAWMKRASVFVSLSRFEGNPNSVLEAMACECPVVVSDIPTHKELVDDESAWLVQVDSVVDVAEAIRAALTNPARARAHARAASQRVANRTPATSAALYVALYRRLLRDTLA